MDTWENSRRPALELHALGRRAYVQWFALTGSFLLLLGLQGCFFNAPRLAAWELGATGQLPDCSVALYGDSILWGAHNGLNRWPDPPGMMLRRLRPRYGVTDRTMPGASAYAEAMKFTNIHLASRIVVLQYGMNDAGKGYPYEAALRAMVLHVKAQRRTAVITGISNVVGGMALRDEYDTTARRVAEETAVEFADWSQVDFDPADMADPVHPGEAYSARLTQRLAETLDRVAPECRGGSVVVPVELSRAYPDQTAAMP